MNPQRINILVEKYRDRKEEREINNYKLDVCLICNGLHHFRYAIDQNGDYINEVSACSRLHYLRWFGLDEKLFIQNSEFTKIVMTAAGVQIWKKEMKETTSLR